MNNSAKPHPLRVTLTPRARAVLCLWAALPGVFAAPFVFWQGLIWGASFCAGWALLVFLLGLRAASFTAELGPRALTIRLGVVFPVRRVLPRRGITSALVFRTPLLRLAGASVLVLFSPGMWAALPGIPARQADLLCGALLAAPPPEEAPS